MNFCKIGKYIKQEWLSEVDVISSLPFCPEEIIKAFGRGMIRYTCRFRFRKNSEASIEACYGLNWLKDKDDDDGIKDAILAMLIHAQDKFGFNWEDFEVMNIKTRVFESGVA